MLWTKCFFDGDLSSIDFPGKDGTESGRENYNAPEIVIGNQVWIACNTVVLGGVHIGDGAVIGAGSVVTKDIPAHYLAFGNPCRPIRPITEADSKRSLILPEDQEHFFYNFKQ